MSQTKEQQAFEVWLSTLPRRPHTPAAYDWCLATWQASRKQALEDAIALFNQPHVEHFGSNIVEMLEELSNDN